MIIAEKAIAAELAQILSSSTSTQVERTEAGRELARRAQSLTADANYGVVKQALFDAAVGGDEELASRATDAFVGIGQSLIPELVELSVSRGDPHYAVDEALEMILFRNSSRHAELQLEIRHRVRNQPSGEHRP